MGVLIRCGHRFGRVGHGWQVVASDEQRVALVALSGSRDRDEADRARAILLTLSCWTSPRIAEAFAVREDTVRLWRSETGKRWRRGVEDQHRAGAGAGEERGGPARDHAVA